MRREWNTALLPFDPLHAERSARALASVAGPSFLASLSSLVAELKVNGQKAVIATLREKYDADGRVITGDDDAAGEFHTDGYGFYAGEDSWQIGRDDTDDSELLALALARLLPGQAIDRIRDMKVILDSIGGQVWISPFIRDEQVLGLAFHWSHVSKLARAKEPDASLDTPRPLTIA